MRPPQVSIFSLLVGTLFSLSDQQSIYLGSLSNVQHGVEGDLYSNGNTTLLLDYFSYDGSDHEVFFKVGTSEKPSEQGRDIMYPECSSKAPLLKLTKSTCEYFFIKQVC